MITKIQTPVKLMQRAASKKLKNKNLCTMQNDSLNLSFKGCTLNAKKSICFIELGANLGKKAGEFAADKYNAMRDYMFYKKLIKASSNGTAAQFIENNTHRKYGVKATFADNEHAANTIYNALGILQSKGYGIPRKIHVVNFGELVDPNTSSKKSSMLTDTGLLLPTRAALFINDNLNWSKVSNKADELYKKHIISTASPQHFILGLLCENLVDKSNHGNFKALFSSYPSPTEAKILRKHVSHVATETKLDAVKEIFVKHVTGMPISSEEIAIYNKYGGPSLKTVN